MPARVAVVGAGYIAIEIVGVMDALGADTHLFVRKEGPLRTFDPLIHSTLTTVMATEGLKLHTRAVSQSVTRNEDGSLSLNFENGQTHQTDCVVWAIGRTFATDGVNLEAAGVATD